MTQRAWRTIPVAVVLCLPLHVRAQNAEETRADAASAPQVIVTLLRATAPEMRLQGDAAPALRRLAARGVIFPELAPLSWEDIATPLRELGATLESGYEEVPLSVEESSSVEEKSDPLAFLIDRLGAPPSPSLAEREALERLRAARAPGPLSAPSPDANERIGSDGNEVRRRSRRKRSPQEAAADRAIAALWGGKRFVLVTDSGETSIGHEALITKATGAVFSYAGGSPADPPRRFLVCVLLPEAGKPALLAAGHRLRQGRFVREALESADIIEGIRWLLGTPREIGDDLLQRGEHRVFKEPQRDFSYSGR